MSPPARACLLGIDIDIIGERLDALLSACRRRHQADALEQLDGWASDGQVESWSDAYDHEKWSRHANEVRARAIADLTAWCRTECRLHVVAGRFEHAIALLERYRPQPDSSFLGDQPSPHIGVAQ